MLENIISLYKYKADFCRAVGIKPQYLVQIEKGNRPIPPKMAIALNEKHNIPLHVSRPDIYPAPTKQAVNQ